MTTNTLIGWLIGALIVIGGGYIVWNSMQAPAMMHDSMATTSDSMMASSSDHMMASSTDSMSSSSDMMIDASTSVDADMVAH